MKKKLLVAVDESENAMKAVEYVAGTMGEGVQITLYHVLPKAPAKGIEKEKILVGHHPVFKEGVDAFRAWIEQRRATMEPVMDKAKRVLTSAGVDQNNIEVKIEQGKEGVARDILNELQQGKYDTVVLGRRGLSGIKAFLLGSVSTKVLHHARGCAVWVVE